MLTPHKAGRLRLCPYPSIIALSMAGLGGLLYAALVEDQSGSPGNVGSKDQTLISLLICY